MFYNQVITLKIKTSLPELNTIPVCSNCLFAYFRKNGSETVFLMDEEEVETVAKRRLCLREKLILQFQQNKTTSNKESISKYIFFFKSKTAT